MSLHFQIDVAFDFKENSSEEIISGLENLANNSSLSDQNKHAIPGVLEREVRGMTGTFSLTGRDIFYFKKHYRSTKNKIDIYRWVFHFRTMLPDDVLYEEGYPLLAWFALNSDTSGFVGYIKEELDADPELLYFENGEVVIKQSPDKIMRFKLSDFKVR